MLLVVVGLLWRPWCRAECGRNAEFLRNYNDVCALDVAVILATLSRGGGLMCSSCLIQHWIANQHICCIATPYPQDIHKSEQTSMH